MEGPMEGPAKVMGRPTVELVPDTTEELTAAQTPEQTADRRRFDGGSGGRLRRPGPRTAHRRLGSALRRRVLG
jgi:hypothetical protein